MRRRTERSFSPQERAEVLEELGRNGGNISEMARKTGIPASSLYRWREQQLQDSMDPQARQMAKFVKNAWKNIHALSNPKFIKQLKAKALEKGNLKEVFAAISILLDKIITLTRLRVQASREAKSDELEDDFTEEDIDKLIKEEKEKIRRERRAGQDEGEA